MDLHLWILRKAGVDYGQTFEMLVAAPTEAAARLLAGRNDWNRAAAFEWVDPEVTKAEAIGIATEGTEPDVIMTKESAS